MADAAANKSSATAPPGSPLSSDAAGKWMYSEMDRVRQKKREAAKVFLREWVFFSTLVCVFGWCTSLIVSEYAQPLYDQLTNSLATDPYSWNRNYYTIVNVTDFYEWLNVKYLPYLRPNQWYDSGVQLELTAEEQQYTSLQMYVVGTVRIRQVRSQLTTQCDVPGPLASFIPDCMPLFTRDMESRESYGAWDDNTTNISRAFVWQSGPTLCQAAVLPGFCNALSIGFPASGFAWEFTADQNTALAELQYLEQSRWIDRQTRSLVVDVTVYNPDVEIISAVKFTAEILQTGEWRVKIDVKSMPTFELTSSRAITQFVAEILLATFVGVYMIREWLEFLDFYEIPRHLCPRCQLNRVLRGETIRRNIVCLECRREYNAFRLPECPCCGRETQSSIHMCWIGYFFDLWNWVDLANQGIFLFILSLRFFYRITLNDLDFKPGNAFVEFHSFALAYYFINWLNAANALLCFAKAFKYLGKFKALSALVRMLGRGRDDLLAFCVLFVTAWAGYAFSFYLAFGSDVKHCQDWGSAMLMTFNAMFGVFDYDSLSRSQPVLAPFLFITYMVLFFFIMLNVFIAIVSEAFEIAKEDIRTGKEDFMGSSLTLQYNEIACRLRLKRGSDMLPEVRRLIYHMQQAKLKPEQLDDLRAFANEVEHNPFNTELFAAVLGAFHGKVDRPMNYEDFNELRRAVVRHRQRQRDAEEGEPEGAELWKGDEENEEDGAELDHDHPHDPDPADDDAETTSLLSHQQDLAGSRGHRPSRFGAPVPSPHRPLHSPAHSFVRPRSRAGSIQMSDAGLRATMRQLRWKSALQQVLLTPHQRQFHGHLKRCEDAVEELSTLVTDMCRALGQLPDLGSRQQSEMTAPPRSYSHVDAGDEIASVSSSTSPFRPS